MQIERAREMGFCFGVRRAINLFEQGAREHGTVESLGAVVHNRQVVNHLLAVGVKVIDGVQQIHGNVVAIPSHGVSRELFDRLKNSDFKIIDATCPFVRRAQNAAQALAQSDFKVVIFGDSDHVEVRGVLGWSQGKGIATRDIDIACAEHPHRLGVMAQTTENTERFAQFIEELTEKYLAGINELRVVNTICDATMERQEAALELAARSDLMLVIGDRHSANTRRLVELCSEFGVETHLVESVQQLDNAWFKGKQHVGITAGASTPDETIEQVINYVQHLE